MRYFLIFLAGAVVLLVSSIARRRTRPQRRHRKLQRRRVESTQVVPNQYLVVFRDDVMDVQETVDRLMQDSPCSQNVEFVYENTIKGFALMDCSESDLAILLEDPAVQFAAEDELVQGNLMSQDVSSNWALDRTDQRDNSLNGNYDYDYDGTGVTIYVLDSGVRSTHVEFGGRASCGYNAYEGVEPCTDNNGHGTFNAAVAAGATYGIAKNAGVVSVRVLRQNLGASVTRIIAGIDFVGFEKTNNATQPMVVNMSLSSTLSGWINGCLKDLFLDFDWQPGCFFNRAGRADALAMAAEKLVDMGVTVVASVDNDPNILKTPFGSCFTSPAKSSKVIAVGASTKSNERAWFSQYGFCLSIFAPGQEVLSAWGFSDESTKIADGTSISTGFVTGVAALYLQKDPSMTPEEVQNNILNDASSGWWLGMGWFTPNRILSTAALLGQ